MLLLLCLLLRLLLRLCLLLRRPVIGSAGWPLPALLLLLLLLNLLHHNRCLWRYHPLAGEAGC